MQSQTIGELAKALCAVQGELKPAIKDSINPFFKSKYADLHSVWQAIQGPLNKNGLSVFQGCINLEGHDYLQTTLLHSSGEYLTSELRLYLSKQDAQGMGSAITYARRYALAAAVGVIQDDDDANAATTADAATRQPSIGKNYMLKSIPVDSINKELKENQIKKEWVS